MRYLKEYKLFEDKELYSPMLYDKYLIDTIGTYTKLEVFKWTEVPAPVNDVKCEIAKMLYPLISYRKFMKGTAGAFCEYHLREYITNSKNPEYADPHKYYETLYGNESVYGPLNQEFIEFLKNYDNINIKQRTLDRIFCSMFHRLIMMRSTFNIQATFNPIKKKWMVSIDELRDKIKLDLDPILTKALIDSLYFIDSEEPYDGWTPEWIVVK